MFLSYFPIEGLLVAGKGNNAVKVEDDDDGLLMTPQLKEKLREKKKKKMGGDYSLDVEDPNELGIVYPTPRICDSSSAAPLCYKKQDMIVDHRNDALS